MSAEGPMPKGRIEPMHPKDLEAIVNLLVIAGIHLTPEPDAQFTFDQLMDEVLELGGGECRVDPADARIVLDNMVTFKRLPGGLLCLR